MLNEWLSSTRLRLKAMWKSRALDRELQEEMAFHLEMRERKLQSAGVDGEEAHYAARRAFGNIAKLKEDTRMLWKFDWLEHLGQDLRYAVRSLRKSPILAAIVVLSLALGIGANTAIFSLINAVMLRLLPVQKPEQLLLLELQNPGSGEAPQSVFTNPLWEAVRDRQDIFSGVFAWDSRHFNLAQGGPVENVQGTVVSGNYFGALGIKPAAGRLLTSADDQRGCAPTVVLSYGFWQSHFGKAADVVGRTLLLERQPFQVIGVSSPGFYGLDIGRSFDIAVPVCSTALVDGKRSSLDNRGQWWLQIMGRIKPGITPEQIKAELGVLAPQVMRAAVPQNWDPESQQGFLQGRLVTAPGATGISYLRSHFGGPLMVLMVIVAIVLLIACANIASLMLARASVRAKEIAIRKALGASRSRLIRQLLTESGLLSAVGALLGLLFARWGSALLVRGLSTGQHQVFLDLSLDGRILGFTGALAILTGTLVGLLPALRSTRVPLMAALKSSWISEDEGRSRYWAGKWIVASQVALSLVLLIGGGLLLRSFVKLLRVDLGFDRNHVLLVTANLASAQMPPEQQQMTFDLIGERLHGLPGVVSAASSYITPLEGGAWINTIDPDLANDHHTGDQAHVFFNAVSPAYFETMQTSLLAGRDFNHRDTGSSQPVAIVSETLARKFFPGTNALGQHFRTGHVAGQPAPLIEVVGIVADSKYSSVGQETPFTAFFPLAQAPPYLRRQRSYELRTTMPPRSLAPAIEKAVAAVNKQVPLEFQTLAQQVDDSLLQQRLLAKLSGFFGALALLLAMVGLYGVLSYLVTQRQTEFGIRMALGAPPRSVVRLVMKDVVAILLIGVAAGLGISLATVSLLQKMLFGLAPRDTFTMLVAVFVLSAMALLAGALPARRASRVDPMVALRYE
jgi:putative ABC transport system permease protein